ncbi:helix-turn-helix transcriptional regulator (plasmid) [Rhizobium sp. NIBRBAC000502774]|nr:helix-turn-helix transcriptional regulator [Rhizobium sp. NIBRBAC000502774]
MVNSRPADIGRRLKQLRKGASLQEFAHELGVEEVEYSAYEAGKREIPTSLLIALLERCAVDPAWVLTGKRSGAAAESVASATTAYRAILEAAERAERILSPDAFSYAIAAALPSVVRSGMLDPVQADVLVKLATLNAGR